MPVKNLVKGFQVRLVLSRRCWRCWRVEKGFFRGAPPDVCFGVGRLRDGVEASGSLAEPGLTLEVRVDTLLPTAIDPHVLRRNRHRWRNLHDINKLFQLEKMVPKTALSENNARPCKSYTSAQERLAS